MAGDLVGGLTAALVALPSAIAYGVISFAPLGPEYAGTAALAGILGTIIVGFTAAVVGGSSRLVSAPCAPAAAVLSVFTATLAGSVGMPLEAIPFAVAMTACAAGLVQIAVGLAGGGRLIKYIPYPVVAGYMSGVGILILLGQIPKIIAAPKGVPVLTALFNPSLWVPTSVVTALVTVAAMVAALRYAKAVPSAVVGLAAGVAAYFAQGLIDPGLLVLEGNHAVIGSLGARPAEIAATVAALWSPNAILAAVAGAAHFIVPALTLAVLLSIDALKSCVVLDALTGERHDSNRVLLGQGLGNTLAALVGGMSGAGTMGASLVNYNSGAKTGRSGIVMAAGSLVMLLVLGPLVAWIPLAALSGVLVVIAVRMVDLKALHLLTNRSTVFDFVVILAVVVAAVTQDLIIAAGVGIGMAILLFLRDQVRFPVIHRRFTLAKVHSKKRHLPEEIEVLERDGELVAVFELQGQLFFGSTDQLYTELEPSLSTARIVILDMKRVWNLDYTAANLLKQIHKRLATRNASLVLAQISSQGRSRPDMLAYLRQLGFGPDGRTLRFAGETDSALEWAEDTLLEEAGVRALEEGRPLEAPEFGFFSPFERAWIKALAEVMVPAHYGRGMPVFSKGDLSNEIYFVRRGLIKIMLPLEDGGTAHHLATFARGDFFGEMAFLDKAPRSADAICADDSELYILKRKAFKKVLKRYPEMGTQFYAQLARTVTNRLRLNHAEIQALEGLG